MTITVEHTYTDLTIDPDTEVLRFPPEVKGIKPGSLDHLTKLHTIWWGVNMMDPIEPGTIPDRPIVLFMPEHYPHQIGDTVPAIVAVCIHTGSVYFSRPSNLPTRSIFFSYAGGSCYSFPTGLHISTFQCSEYDCNGAIAVYRSPDNVFKPTGSPGIDTFSDYWDAVSETEPISPHLKRKHDWSLMTYKERTLEQIFTSMAVSKQSAPIEPTPTGPPKIKPVLDYARLQELKCTSDKVALERLSAEALSLSIKIKSEIEQASTDGTLSSYFYSHAVLPSDAKLVDMVREYLPCLNITLNGGMMRVRV